MLLLALSRGQNTRDFESSPDGRDVVSALTLLENVFPDFNSSIAGMDILDFGCGAGLQSVALAKRGAHLVVGLETNPRAIRETRENIVRHAVEDKVEIVDTFDDRLRERFDIVICKDSMEHFGDPAGTLMAMDSALKPHGILYLTFGPPWFAPYGSHMHFFTRVPYVNLFFPERTVMNVRARFRSDGARRYEEVESGLNRMTVRKFERIIGASGMHLRFRRDGCIKGMTFLRRIPVARELFINQVSCILSRGLSH